MAAVRPTRWAPVIGMAAAVAMVAAGVGWRLHLETLERRVKDRRAALKKLGISGGIPPNPAVLDYFGGRLTALEQAYESWQRMVAPALVAEADGANPQVHFQEQLHEVQQALERLATSHGMLTPQQLGFPKELPPPEVVPRLLAQLSLVKEAAELIMEQGVTLLSSFKLEDPQAVANEGGEGAFLIRVPVRVLLTGSLAQAMKVLEALGRSRPVVDVRALRLAQSTEPNSLDVELLLCRYLVMPATEEPAMEDEPRADGKKPPARAGRPGSSRDAASSGRARDDTERPKNKRHR